MKSKEYDSWEWRELRDEVLAEADYTCADCGGRAETAHHRHYRYDILDRSSLVALCWPCHERRHGRDPDSDWDEESY
jgi:5-methylcytosine-specific restriction endonuclease McrA